MNTSTDKLITRLACYFLIASGFVLSGFLLTQARDYVDNPAQAAMVINRDNLTLMTAKTRNGEESLFVLDNQNARLFVYRVDINRNQMNLVGLQDLNEIFSTSDDQPGRRR
ncbi:hypothetical protein [Mucisphaera calidilacus]|uniref:Uncharacterized protein n=1 Tax=Mucisphaera calidilacus TaxID=2527982 RepID=A0A518BYE2_9BACT|nr:hypothetical protein [Mucisphaera calidilacus]QDU71978.1 hypothetical protein Pan265_18370 [Mucisphaera calidilacus]